MSLPKVSDSIIIERPIEPGQGTHETPSGTMSYGYVQSR